VTQAAILLALPPNQNGYRIEVFLVSFLSFVSSATTFPPPLDDSTLDAILAGMNGSTAQLVRRLLYIVIPEEAK
jgi:hypothetical protein